MADVVGWVSTIGCALAHRLWHTAIDVWRPPFYPLPRRMRQHPQRDWNSSRVVRERARVGVALAISHPMQNRHPVGQPSITPSAYLSPLHLWPNELMFATTITAMVDDCTVVSKSQSLPPPQPFLALRASCSSPAADARASCEGGGVFIAESPTPYTYTKSAPLYVKPGARP